MAWSLRDMADVLEAEEELKTLADTVATDDYFQDLMFRVTRDTEAARKARYFRMLARKWRQTERG